MKPSINKLSKLIPTLGLIGALGGGFLLGALHDTNKETPIESIHLREFREISLIKLKAIEGDSLLTEISGPARILWNDEMVEKDGEYEIPLGQIETENDREFKSFAYVGNAKTNNFYPSSSYPARGTETRYRRFFQTKEEAIDAGFNPSKLVK